MITVYGKEPDKNYSVNIKSIGKVVENVRWTLIWIKNMKN